VTVWVTLYLGQVSFSDRFSRRLAWRMFWRGFIQMVVFQTIVRDMAMCTWILSPVALTSLYHMNQIILLEQTTLSQTWPRRTAFNTRNLGYILQLIIIEGLILLLGYLVISRMLFAISALWRDRFSIVQQMMVVVEDPGSILGLDQWENQLAWWISVAFTAVWRYTTYLDCRVRREGWDVELRIRTQAYALRRWEAR
jgi:hypothetical protein